VKGLELQWDDPENLGSFLRSGLTVPLCFDHVACMKKKRFIQYTIRKVPDEIDLRLRGQASREKCSLNGVVLDALACATGAKDEPVVFHDLDALIGSWVNDEGFDQAMNAFEQVDEERWQ